jgi:hypothetical protein
MAASLVKSTNTLGITLDCDTVPCSAIVFYDRVRDLAGGNVAPSEVVLGRLMARQVGQLLLGANYHSRTGIMQASWSSRQFSLLAVNEVSFTSQESRAMKTELAGQEHAWQSQHAGQTLAEAAVRDNKQVATPATQDTAVNRR